MILSQTSFSWSTFASLCSKSFSDSYIHQKCVDTAANSSPLFLSLSITQEIDFDFVFDAENDTVTITPYGAFLGREKCRVSFPDIKTGVGAIAKGDTFIEFTVDFPLCAILSCEADSVVPGEYATFDVEVRNTPDDSKDGIVMIAIYKDGGLERVGTAPLLCEGQTEESCEVSCFIPEGYNSDDYEMIAYYVYQNSLYVIDYIGIE